MIQSLEARILFSYSIDINDPNAVTQAGYDVIHANASEVLAGAGDGISGPLGSV